MGKDYSSQAFKFLSVSMTRFVTFKQTGKGRGAGAPKEKVNWKEKRKLKEVQKVKKEAEQRQEGLVAAIPSSNIGFKMLQQMGYKPGNALGKSGQGATEPISVNVKVNRTGLGRDRVVAEEKVLKAKVKALVQEKKRKKVDELREGFEERRRGTWQSRKLISDYRKAYTALLQLEEQSSGSAEGVLKVNMQEAKGAVEKKEEKKKQKDEDADEEEEEEEEVITEEVSMYLMRLEHGAWNHGWKLISQLLIIQRLIVHF